MSKGWISLNREIMKHWLWDKKPFSYGQAWVHILLSCNHAPAKVLIRGELIPCDRGQSVKCLKTWSDEFGWSLQSTRTFFNLLEKDKNVNIEGLRKTTRLTVCNYDTYQEQQHTNNTQTTHKQHTANTQPTTNNNDNNVNNENKEEFVEGFEFTSLTRKHR